MGNTRLRSLPAMTAALLLLWGATASADTFTFSTVPSSGDIQGTAGSTIGWGYSITNNSMTDWLVVTDLSADPFADGVPDASPFDYPVVAPGTMVSLAYDPVADTGLFALTWNASAPVGFTDSGLFTVDAEWWTGDPFVGGAFIQDAAPQTAAYEATVSSAATGPSAPEPSSFLLIVAALAFAVALRCVRTQNVIGGAG